MIAAHLDSITQRLRVLGVDKVGSEQQARGKGLQNKAQACIVQRALARLCRT